MNDKIDIELAEDEELARAKAWWKENGSSIIAGILIGTTIVLGYNYWKSYQEEHAQEVAGLYESFLQAPADSAKLEALQAVDEDAVLTQVAKMAAAKEAFSRQQYEQAENLLQGVLDAGPDEGLRAVVVVRLATAYLADNKPDQALALVEAQKASGRPLFQGRLDELKGDIYLKKGDPEKARASYQSSIDALTEAGQPVALIQLKLDNL